MSEILREGKPYVPPHKCGDDLPGKTEWFSVDLSDINPGTIARCTCGKLYEACKLYGTTSWYRAGLWLRWKYRNQGRRLEA